MSGLQYPFGTDTALILENGLIDIDTTFAVLTDEARVLLYDLLKIITTTSGTLWWAPTATEDASQAQCDAISPARLVAFQARLQNAVEQDARYTSVVVSIVKRGPDMAITITCEAANRNLRLVLVTNADGTLSVEELTTDGAVL
jgi:hypothetical protein